MERQGRIANQADAQGGADAPAGQATEWTRKRFTKPEPKVNPGPWVDEAPAPPAPAPEADRPNLAVPATAAVLLVLALGAATWWLRHRRPPPEPTT